MSKPIIQGVPNSSARPKGDDRGGPNEQKILWEGGVYLSPLRR